MPKGMKTGGRAKGTPNKVTAEGRALFQQMFARVGPKLEHWIKGGREEGSKAAPRSSF